MVLGTLKEGNEAQNALCWALLSQYISPKHPPLSPCIEISKEPQSWGSGRSGCHRKLQCLLHHYSHASSECHMEIDTEWNVYWMELGRSITMIRRWARGLKWFTTDQFSTDVGSGCADPIALIPEVLSSFSQACIPALMTWFSTPVPCLTTFPVFHHRLPMIIMYQHTLGHPMNSCSMHCICMGYIMLYSPILLL